LLPHSSSSAADPTDDDSVISGDLHRIQISWTTKFRGNSLKTFSSVLDDLEDTYNKKYYAKVLPVAQSSGVGKPRLLDELSKERVGLCFTHRLANQSGYPPGDVEIANYSQACE
jgi:hypothetical protein